MNAKTQAQINRMKEQTIGVEVEMNNITRKAAAKLAAEFFGTNRYEDTAFRNGYYTWSAWDAQGREWKFQRDCSISGPDSEKCELVTPILHYEAASRKPAGADQTPSQGRRKERLHQRLRSSHSHRRSGTHTAEPAKPRKPDGKPRNADRRSNQG